MSEQVKIQKTIYGLQSFNNVVNTNFSQLTTPTKPTPDTTSEATIEQFFSDYETLFYEIPLSGSDNSHLGLATRSLEYLGLSLDDLRNEIENLREENIGLKTQILDASQINIGTQV